MADAKISWLLFLNGVKAGSPNKKFSMILPANIDIIVLAAIFNFFFCDKKTWILLKIAWASEVKSLTKNWEIVFWLLG